MMQDSPMPSRPNPAIPAAGLPVRTPAASPAAASAPQPRSSGTGAMGAATRSARSLPAVMQQAKTAYTPADQAGDAPSRSRYTLLQSAAAPSESIAQQASAPRISTLRSR